MVRQKQPTIPGIDHLPGDIRDKRGRRHERSRWAYLRREIRVEAHHIAEAMRGDSQSCMIAEAIKEQLPGAKNVVVDIATIRWTDTKKHRRIICLTPMPAQEGLVAFDRGFQPEPFVFRVEPVQILQTDAQVKAEGRIKPRLERTNPNGATKTTDGKPRRTNGSTERNAALRMHGLSAGTPDTKILEEFVVLGGKSPPHHHASRKRKFGMKGFTWDDPEPASTTPIG